jgi:pimeloyl-ACP methyl ester carboxylesterase
MTTFRSLPALFLIATTALAQDVPKKKLPLEGEVFDVAGHTAFLIPGKPDPLSTSRPWVWYAPTLPNLPGSEELWMFERFQAAGIAVAGIDAGESYGSPDGNKVFDSLYAALIARGYSTRPILLGRSRGGLMTLSWAVAHPDKVAGFAGIYPVCDLASYPGIDKAAGAYKLKPEELRARLAEFTPVDRLAGLAKAKVPLFAIHGDIDKVVPLEANSGKLKERYTALGGSMTLIVPPAQGHNMWPGFFQCQELVDFVRVQAGVELALDSPLDYQVVQRNDSNVGVLHLRGKLGDTARQAKLLEYRLSAEGHSGDWRKLDGSIQDGVFAATTTAPAGGWYRLDVRAIAEGKPIGHAAVNHVGIGEVFVVAGQSNSANYGAEKQNTKTGRVSAFDGSRWQLANDPISGAKGPFGSFMPPFGDALTKKLGMPVGIVACGVGGTSIREWLPAGTTFPIPPTIETHVRKLDNGLWESKGNLYPVLRDRMKQLGPHGFRAVLWHQGESDANQKDATRTLPGKLYREYMEKLIRSIRQEIGWDAPWFVAQATYHGPHDEGTTDIRAAQASLWKDGIALQGPDTDTLKGPMREKEGKGVHFSGPGLRAHAELWVKKVVPWLEKQMGNADR